MSGFKSFLQRKDIVFSAKRYGIDALGAMAQGLFASLLIGTILSTLGQQIGVPVLEQIGGFASSVKGAAMAIAIGYALHCPPLVLFSLAAVLVGFMITASYLNPQEFFVKAPSIPIMLFMLAIFGFIALAYYIGGKRILKCNLADTLRNDSME